MYLLQKLENQLDHLQSEQTEVVYPVLKKYNCGAVGKPAARGESETTDNG